MSRGAQRRVRVLFYAFLKMPLAMPLASSSQLTSVVLRAGLISLVAVLGLGCDDAAEPQAQTTAQQTKPAAPEIPGITWLDSHSKITPGQWLASRQANADLKKHDPAVEAMNAELFTAARRFGEKPRMIANRAVQLEGMLAAQGIHESAPDLIELLASTADIAGGKEGFGAVCQHYFNLRQQGIGRDAALQQLKEARALHVSDPASHG